MEKMAIFVEGQTEQAFAEALVLRIAGERNIHIDSVKGYGGSLFNPRQFLEVSALSRPDPTKKYYVIIYDSTDSSLGNAPSKPESVRVHASVMRDGISVGCCTPLLLA